MADLNLKFENGKAPALNADNMNKIVNEINRTNAKTKDLQSEIATLVIEKGGSIVQANPEEVPTEKITSIRINEDVFEMASETGIEVTQEVYNAMEAAGEIEADVNYFVKDATTSSDSFAEEISKIKTSLNTLEDVSGKFSSNSTYVSSGAIYAYKLGKLVTLNCHFNLKSAVNSWSGYIFTSSLAFKVSTNQYPKIFAFDNSGNCYPLRWYNDGFVTIKNIPATSSEITILATLPLA